MSRILDPLVQKADGGTSEPEYRGLACQLWARTIEVKEEEGERRHDSDEASCIVDTCCGDALRCCNRLALLDEISPYDH